MTAAADAQIAAIRRFNRGYTRTLGLLQPGGMYPPLSLPEARVVYEIASADGITAGEIGARLDLDRGYLSRLVAKLGQGGFVATEADPADARRRRLSLTPAGEALFAEMNTRSEQQAGELLAPLHPLDRHAVLEGLEKAERLWARPEAVPVTLRDPLPGDLGWVLERHGAYYAEANGWGPKMEAGCAETIVRFLRGFDPLSDRAFIAERNGERLGSLIVMREDAETARIRLVMVEPKARGLGLGARLVREAVAFARQAGYRRMILWTQSVLVDARRIYATAGFRKTGEALHTEFGPESLGETWELDL